MVHDKLRIFYDMKDERAKRYSGTSLYLEVDLHEVHNPANRYLPRDMFWKEMTRQANLDRPNLFGLDSTTCIWCYAFSGNCHKCTYGKRNGICGDNSDDDSRWQRVVNQLMALNINQYSLFSDEWYINLINYINSLG